MILSLLRQVAEEARKKAKESGALESEKEEKLAKFLARGVAEHAGRLKETIDKDTQSLVAEEKEQKKHITSEDLHDGFSSKVWKTLRFSVQLPRLSVVCASQSRTSAPPYHQNRGIQEEKDDDGIRSSES